MHPLLQRLGYDADDQIIIIHPDDIGMCQATLPAYTDLLAFGLISSATTMVPCPWFPTVAAFCQEHPEVDMGVHLTLASEWDAYRWGPISTRDPASGLLDAEGYFHHWPREVWATADPLAIEREITAQLDRALAAGIDVTHLDAHMDILVHPHFLPAYSALAQRYQLPFLAVGLEERFQGHRDAELAAAATQMTHELREQQVLLFADLRMPPLDESEDRVTVCKHIIDTLVPGLTLLRIHPAHDTPELRAMAPDWRSRVADYEAFLSEELRDYVRRSGVHVIGYRTLRDGLRAELSATPG